MRTRSVNTEILYNLSPSKNITDSLTKFGVGNDDTAVVVAVIDNSLDSIKEVIKGDWVDFDKVTDNCDKKLLTKTYKLSQDELGENLVNSIISKIAAKDAL